MTTTPRYALGFIEPGQSQKELVHNEALQTIDALVGGCVEELPLNIPPGAPQPGNCYIVGSQPTGDWAGEGGKLAAYTSGGWRFIEPAEGLAVFVRSSAVDARFRAGSWELGQARASRLLIGGQQVVGSQAAAIANPSGGLTADAEARSAIGQILAALRAHGLIAT